MWDHCVPTNMASSWGAATTRAIFFQSQRSFRAKLKIVSATAMAKLTIDSASLESLVTNREIFIILSKIGSSSAKSGDLEALVHAVALPLPHKASSIVLLICFIWSLVARRNVRTAIIWAIPCNYGHDSKK